jgi:hypothetical protein
MTIRSLAAAALLACAAGPARAQGWGGDGNDVNRPAEAKPSAKPAAKPAKPAPAAPAAAANELSDAALDRERTLTDRRLGARKARLDQKSDALSHYHVAMAQDSYEAERQMAEERKAFLLYLKSVPQEERAESLKAFEARLDGKRRELDRRHLSQYKAWFDENVADDWRSQPLSAEAVPMSMAPVAAAPAAREEMVDAPAEAAPAPKPKAPSAAPARAKVKKRAKR